MNQMNATHPWPKYHQVYLVLRQQIQEGWYSTNRLMPNEMVLAEKFSVSRITIRKAMDRLKSEGRIERHRGRGTYPRPETVASPVQAAIVGTIENLIAMGLETNVRVVSLTYVGASSEVAEALGLPPGSTVQKTIRIRSYRGRIFSHLLTYVPEELGHTYNENDLMTHPLLLLLERAGAEPHHAEQMISATLASPEVASLLEIEAASALLSIRRVVYDKTARQIEYMKGLYRPDTYEQQMNFKRRTGTGQFWDIDRQNQPDQYIKLGEE